MTVTKIAGGVSVDDRGKIIFLNVIPGDKFKRMYAVMNHQKGFVRAWHGHEKESKWVTVIKGSAMIGIVEANDMLNPSPSCKCQRVVLSESSPSLLEIPPRCFNGAMTLSDDTIILYFAETTLEETAQDDFRRSWDFFGKEVWEIIPR